MKFLDKLCLGFSWPRKSADILMWPSSLSLACSENRGSLSHRHLGEIWLGDNLLAEVTEGPLTVRRAILKGGESFDLSQGA